MTNLPILYKSGLVSSSIVYIGGVRRFAKPSTTTVLLEYPFFLHRQKIHVMPNKFAMVSITRIQILKVAGLRRTKQKSFQYRLKQFITGSTAEFHIL